jgi:16S rRNA (guanine966-N2)-methyltransferase
MDGGWLESDALCIVEETAKAEIFAPPGLAVVDERVYGDTRIAILDRGRSLRGHLDVWPAQNCKRSQ